MSFLYDYLLYASDNEAPDMYHVWAGFTTLSAAVSRKVWLPQGEFAIFPNIYVMLVGDAGDGKSTAMRYAKRLIALSQADNPLAVGFHVSAEIETPQGMWNYMAGDPLAKPPTPSPVKFIARWPDGALRDCHPMTIIANEFVDFIKPDPEGWVSSLNNIYDQDRYQYRTKHQGDDNMDGPYMVLIGGLTTGRSHALQQQSIIETGLARRTIFQYGQRKFHDPHPRLQATASQNAARNRCVDHLKKLNKLAFTGEFTWSTGTQEWWDAWYCEHSKLVPTRPPQTKSWFTSKPDQVLKLGLLTSLSEDFDLRLEVKHLEVGLQYLTVLEQDLMKVFGGAGRNELASVAMKIYEFVQYLPEPMSSGKLRTQFFAICRPPNDFDQCLNHLCDSGLVVRYQGIIPENKVRVDIVGTPEMIGAFVAKFERKTE